MKKTIVTVLALIITGSVAVAQSLDAIKNMYMLNQLEKAKEDLDKAMGNSKINSKPEAYILKTGIYAALGASEGKKNTPAGDQLIAEAHTAFSKYKEMDKSLAMVTEQFYQNGPYYIYTYYFAGGYSDYQNKKWVEGFEKFVKADDYSLLLMDKKILAFPIDTNLNILAGITAEQSGNKDGAVKYYERIADAKIGGSDYESIYRFLVGYHFAKKHFDKFETYKTLGAELYPQSEFFKYDKIDFAVGIEPAFDSKLAMLQEVLAGDPNNYKANQVLGEIIYDTLNSSKEGAIVPSNAAELEKTMLAAFGKAAAAKPESELSYLYMGDHAINKAAKLGDERAAHTKAMQARTKPGTKASPEDIKKRDDLDKMYADALDGARDPYEKAAAIFAAKSSLDNKDKQQYRKVAGYLGDIYTNKKLQATKAKNAADIAKYTAEEKKWNDKYSSIK